MNIAISRYLSLNENRIASTKNTQQTTYLSVTCNGTNIALFGQNVLNN